MNGANSTGSFADFVKSEQVQLRTTTDIVLEVLRGAIERGVLAPGQRIEEEDVAKALSVSRMPVRQAIRALASEGLVRHIPHVGAMVTTLSPEEIEEIYGIRCAMEQLAIRRAVPLYTARDFAALRACLAEMESSLGDEERFLPLNTRFHQLLYLPSGWPRLVEMTEQLRRNVNRYIRFSIQAPNRFRVSHEEHRAILEACESRNAVRAEQLVKEHLINVAQALLSRFNDQENA